MNYEAYIGIFENYERPIDVDVYSETNNGFVVNFEPPIGFAVNSESNWQCAKDMKCSKG